MKKLLFLGASFLLTMNASFASCGCREPKFTAADETAAIENFVETRLDNGVVKYVTLKEVIPVATYTPPKVPILTPMYAYFPYNTAFGNVIVYMDPYFYNRPGYDQSGLTACEVQCANKQHSIKIYSVTYATATKECSVELRVSMRSTVFGYKSKIKQLKAAVCE